MSDRMPSAALFDVANAVDPYQDFEVCLRVNTNARVLLERFSSTNTAGFPSYSLLPETTETTDQNAFNALESIQARPIGTKIQFDNPDQNLSFAVSSDAEGNVSLYSICHINPHVSIARELIEFLSPDHRLAKENPSYCDMSVFKNSSDFTNAVQLDSIGQPVTAPLEDVPGSGEFYIAGYKDLQAIGRIDKNGTPFPMQILVQAVNDLAQNPKSAEATNRLADFLGGKEYFDSVTANLRSVEIKRSQKALRQETIDALKPFTGEYSLGQSVINSLIRADKDEILLENEYRHNPDGSELLPADQFNRVVRTIKEGNVIRSTMTLYFPHLRDEKQLIELEVPVALDGEAIFHRSNPDVLEEFEELIGHRPKIMVPRDDSEITKHLTLEEQRTVALAVQPNKSTKKKDQKAYRELMSSTTEKQLAALGLLLNLTSDLIIAGSSDSQYTATSVSISSLLQTPELLSSKKIQKLLDLQTTTLKAVQKNLPKNSLLDIGELDLTLNNKKRRSWDMLEVLHGAQRITGVIHAPDMDVLTNSKDSEHIIISQCRNAFQYASGLSSCAVLHASSSAYNRASNTVNCIAAQARRAPDLSLLMNKNIAFLRWYDRRSHYSEKSPGEIVTTDHENVLQLGGRKKRTSRKLSAPQDGRSIKYGEKTRDGLIRWIAPLLTADSPLVDIFEPAEEGVR